MTRTLHGVQETKHLPTIKLQLYLFLCISSNNVCVCISEKTLIQHKGFFIFVSPVLYT